MLHAVDLPEVEPDALEDLADGELDLDEHAENGDATFKHHPEVYEVSLDEFFYKGAGIDSFCRIRHANP